MTAARTRGRETYQKLRASHLHFVQAALADHVVRVEWPRERIEHYQTERLRGLLAFARQRSPFHADRIRDLDPSSVTIDDLARLPPMTKQDAQDEWDAIVTAPGIDRAKAERILSEQQWFSYTPSGEQFFSSGGSSGVRGVYVWGWQLFVTLACLAWRMQAREERRAARSGRRERLGVLTAGEPPHASTPLFDIATTPGMQTTVIRAGAPFDEVLASVAELQPTHLVGYASVIGRLARASAAGELDVRPVRVSTNSEPLSAEDRAAIEAAWQAPIHNLWGSTEIGVQAVGCGVGDGLHVCEDEVVLERVDRDGRPVGPDEPAERTLATGLADLTFPFIRYDLGDKVTMLPGQCPCGSTLVRVADISGRQDDDFRYGPLTVPASAFRHVLGSDARISEYQVRQTIKGADVSVVGAPDIALVRQALIESLRRHGLSAPEVRIAQVATIERHATTSKLKRFIPLLP